MLPLCGHYMYYSTGRCEVIWNVELAYQSRLRLHTFIEFFLFLICDLLCWECVLEMIEE